jgi:hypothetical protein
VNIEISESVVVGCFDFLKAFLDTQIFILVKIFEANFLAGVCHIKKIILKNFVASCNFCLSGISQNIDLLDYNILLWYLWYFEVLQQ